MNFTLPRKPPVFPLVLLYYFVLLQHQLFHSLDLMYQKPKIQVLKLIGFCKVAKKKKKNEYFLSFSIFLQYLGVYLIAGHEDGYRLH